MGGCLLVGGKLYLIYLGSIEKISSLRLNSKSFSKISRKTDRAIRKGSESSSIFSYQFSDIFRCERTRWLLVSGRVSRYHSLVQWDLERFGACRDNPNSSRCYPV